MYLLHRKKIDIYANVSLFLSYSEVTVATRSGPYPAQMMDQQCWGKLLLKVTHYNIALLPKKVTNYVT